MWPLRPETADQGLQSCSCPKRGKERGEEGGVRRERGEGEGKGGEKDQGMGKGKRKRREGRGE